jgi:hypothetical protein
MLRPASRTLSVVVCLAFMGVTILRRGQGQRRCPWKGGTHASEAHDPSQQRREEAVRRS